MNNEQILPVLDLEVLKKKATDSAMKGAMESINDYYTGYSSPFKKTIEAMLKEQKMGYGIELPDVIALINESLSAEIDKIANTAVAKTFVPLVSRFLVGADKEVLFSDMLKEFIEATDSKDMDDCSCEVYKRPSPYDWCEIKLYGKDFSIDLTLHKNNDKLADGEKQKYSIISLPYDKDTNQKMKLSINGATLELPFVKDVLENDFIAYIARLIMADSNITMDCADFEEDMFPEGDHCHCD